MKTRPGPYSNFEDPLRPRVQGYKILGVVVRRKNDVVPIPRLNDPRKHLATVGFCYLASEALTRDRQ